MSHCSHSPWLLVLQLRPEDDIADREFQAILTYGRIAPSETHRLRIHETGIPDIDLNDYAGIIVGGSPFDISTAQEQKSAAQQKIEQDFARLFDRVVAQDMPFLGACSGNGLLGHYCGASISTRFGEPVGGVDVTLTDAGRIDPLTHTLPGRFRVLVGHKEACDDVPPGSVLLASGERCAVQMFRVGANVYATQFHPEADAQGFAARIHAYKSHGYFDPAEADSLIAELSGESTPHAQEILRRFAELYRP